MTQALTLMLQIIDVLCKRALKVNVPRKYTNNEDQERVGKRKDIVHTNVKRVILQSWQVLHLGVTEESTACSQ